MWCVYKHENLLNGKVYIGITSKSNAEERWGKYGRKYHSQSKFFDAILQYGWDNFSHIILYDKIETRVEALKIETSLIEQYDSINNGYNSVKSFYEEDEENKIQYIDVTTKKVYTSMNDLAKDLNVTISCISKYFSKNRKTCQGHVLMYKHLYDELSEQEQLSLLQCSPKVICVETQEVFDSAEAAAKKFTDKKGGKSYILRACQNGTTAYKFHWIFC